MRFDFYTGDIKDKYGFKTRILKKLLSNGTIDLPKEKFNDYLIENDINLVLSADDDGIFITCSYENQKMPQMINLVKQQIFSPNFDENEFNKIRNEMLKNIDLSEYDLEDKIYKYLYPDSFYSNEEIKEIINNITFNDIKELYMNIMKDCSLELTTSEDFNNNPNLYSYIDYEMSNFTAPFMTTPVFKVFDKTKDKIKISKL